MYLRLISSRLRLTKALKLLRTMISTISFPLKIKFKNIVN